MDILKDTERAEQDKAEAAAAAALAEKTAAAKAEATTAAAAQAKANAAAQVKSDKEIGAEVKRIAKSGKLNWGLVVRLIHSRASAAGPHAAKELYLARSKKEAQSLIAAGSARAVDPKRDVSPIEVEQFTARIAAATKAQIANFPPPGGATSAP